MKSTNIGLVSNNSLTKFPQVNWLKIEQVQKSHEFKIKAIEKWPEKLSIQRITLYYCEN